MAEGTLPEGTAWSGYGPAPVTQCREDALGPVTDAALDVAMGQRVQPIRFDRAKMRSAATSGSIMVAIPPHHPR